MVLFHERSPHDAVGMKLRQSNIRGCIYGERSCRLFDVKPSACLIALGLVFILNEMP